MRLRPSGRQGPLATALAAFRRYQAEEAWTWEHLALTRARVVAGPRAARPVEVAAAIAEVLDRPHDAAKVLADAEDMRRRLAEAHEAAAANPWEVKLGPGRMMDIELLAQAGALIHGPRRARSPRRMLGEARRRRAGSRAADAARARRRARPARRAAAGRPARQRPHHRPGRGRRGPGAPGPCGDRPARPRHACAAALAAEAARSAAIIADRGWRADDAADRLPPRLPRAAAPRPSVPDVEVRLPARGAGRARPAAAGGRLRRPGPGRRRPRRRGARARLRRAGGEPGADAPPRSGRIGLPEHRRRRAARLPLLGRDAARRAARARARRRLQHGRRLAPRRARGRRRLLRPQRRRRSPPRRSSTRAGSPAS